MESLSVVAKKPLGPGCHELRRRQPVPCSRLALVVSVLPGTTLFQHDGGPTCSAVERRASLRWGAPLTVPSDRRGSSPLLCPQAID
jgi:hypothetical protein